MKNNEPPVPEPDSVKKPSKIINLVDVKKTKEQQNSQEKSKEYSSDELVQEGMTIFSEQIKAGAKGFISVIFDKEDNPVVVTVGDIDPFKMIGALDFCKTEITNTMIYGNMGSEIAFDEDFDE